MRILMIVCALVASCEGRCNPGDAAREVVPAGSICASDRDLAICIASGDEVIVCNVDGAFTYTVRCASLGKIVSGPAEAAP